MKTLAKFAKCESGATAIEYGLIAALIGVAIITAYVARSNVNAIAASSATVRVPEFHSPRRKARRAIAVVGSSGALIRRQVP